MCRYQLSEEGEWLAKKLNVEVERAEDGSISLQDLRKISKLAAQRSADYCVTSCFMLVCAGQICMSNLCLIFEVPPEGARRSGISQGSVCGQAVQNQRCSISWKVSPTLRNQPLQCLAAGFPELWNLLLFRMR